ncbi:MAG: hypothetical protein ABIH83_00515 [Candidatus Micrarchaeota archaeon]
MPKMKILKYFEPGPFFIQICMLSVSVIFIELVAKPSYILPSQLPVADTATALLYLFLCIILVEDFMRKTSVEITLSTGEGNFLFSKKSPIPLPWFNSERKLPYPYLEKLILSKNPLDLGHNEKFYSKIAKKITSAFFKKEMKKAKASGIYFITLIQRPESLPMKIGLFDFNADISNYNLAIKEKDALSMVPLLKDSVNLEFVFN